MNTEPTTDAAFALARERLASEDAARREWLDKWCKKAGGFGLPPPSLEPKASPVPGMCSISGCQRQSRARGMCDRHYRAARKAEVA